MKNQIFSYFRIKIPRVVFCRKIHKKLLFQLDYPVFGVRRGNGCDFFEIFTCKVKNMVLY